MIINFVYCHKAHHSALYSELMYDVCMFLLCVKYLHTINIPNSMCLVVEQRLRMFGMYNG